MAQTRVADLIAQYLDAAGVERIWGLVGDSLNGLTDALRVTGKPEWVPVRHEEVAAFAAGAEAQLTGKLAVCCGSCGPGNMHLINGLYDAHRSRAPVLAIAAHIPSPELGSGYFQETRPEELFRDCSHYCELVSNPTQIPRLLEIAMRTAVHKQGVAVLVIPGDIALQTAVEREVHNWNEAKPALVQPNPESIEALADMLNGADRVTLLCGAGCAGAHDEVVELAGKLQAPVVHALRGKEHIEYDNPYDVGMTGLIGFSSGYHAMFECDALLMLGSDFPYRQFYPKDAKIAQVDIRPEHLGRRAHLDVGVIGDVKETIAALMPKLKGGKSEKFLKKAQAHYKVARKGLDDLATGKPGQSPIHPQYLARMIDEVAADDAVFTCDVGETTVWAARYLTMNGKRRLLGSLIHGSMANAMPQAIGVQGAFPGRQVVSMSGDGGFAMLMGDILTIRQLKLPVKIVVFNNGLLGFVDMEMKAAGFLNVGTTLDNPNFAEMASTMGIKGIRVEDAGTVRAALEEAFAHDGPALVDVVTDSMELVMPPAIKAEHATGFSLYAAKAVLSGRGNELVELAKSQLLR